MKKLILLTAIILGIGMVSCDKIPNPVVVQTTLDTSLFPGNFAGTYVYPTFSPNTNTEKNVLLEDNTVTIRDRDTMEQERVAISELQSIIDKKVNIKTLFA